VNVISKRGLMQKAKKHPEAVAVLDAFYRAARKAEWHGIREVRQDFPSADQVGEVLIFNVLGGNYRLIATVHYPTQRLFIKSLLTHKEYDRKEWLKWA
jgi:mRNA interferase HigB